jgi:hypothetical protein
MEAWGGKAGCEGYKYGQATFTEEEGSVTRKFLFAELQIGE